MILIDFGAFLEFTGMDEDDVMTQVAWYDYIDQRIEEDGLPLNEWWAEYQGDYV